MSKQIEVTLNTLTMVEEYCNQINKLITNRPVIFNQELKAIVDQLNKEMRASVVKALLECQKLPCSERDKWLSEVLSHD